MVQKQKYIFRKPIVNRMHVLKIPKRVDIKKLEPTYKISDEHRAQNAE